MNDHDRGVRVHPASPAQNRGRKERSPEAPTFPLHYNMGTADPFRKSEATPARCLTRALISSFTLVDSKRR
jgi:hypothetical protein